MTGEWTGEFLAFREAVLSEDLTAPSSSLVPMTNCTMHFLVANGSGGWELDPDSFEGYNRDPDLTGDRGTYCRLQRLFGVWVIYYMGCEPQSALIAALDELEE